MRYIIMKSIKNIQGIQKHKIFQIITIYKNIKEIIFIMMNTLTKRNFLSKINNKTLASVQHHHPEQNYGNASLQQIHCLKNISSSIDKLIQLTMSHDRQSRDQVIISQNKRFSTPHNRQQRNANIEEWVTKMVSKVLSQTFNKYQAGELLEQQMKVYCSEQFIRNIILLTKEDLNELTSQDYQVINKALIKSLTYASYKYPLTDNNNQIHKKLDKQIQNLNALDSNANNMILNSDLTFDYNESGNYNEEIMRFLNFIMHTIDVRDESGKNRYQRFQDFFQNIFLKVENMVWVSQMEQQPLKHSLLQQIHKRVEKASQQFEMQCQKDSKLKETAEIYKQKVRSYTSFHINRKISENTKQYTATEINSGNIDIKSTAISRILMKWCEQLEKKFEDESYFIKKEQDIPQKSGENLVMLKNTRTNVSKLFSKEKQRIQQFLKNIKKNSYESQSEMNYSNLKKDNIHYIDEEQKVLGKFAAKSFKCLQTYLLVYLYRLLHGLITISKQFFETSLKNLYLSWKSPPQFVTFLIGDLIRCKFSSGQKQVLRIYRELKILSQLQPQKIKIVRVKNRLKSSTNDILINIRFQDLILCQIQLSVKKNSVNKFISNSGKFQHYIYELTRTKFGPITQIANIWFTKDPRFKEYQKIMKQDSKYLKKLWKRSQSFHQCQQRQMQVQQLPFICSVCNCNSYGNIYLTSIIDNIKCSQCKSYYICGQCRLKNMNKKTIINVLFKNRPQNHISNIKLAQKGKLPNYGIFVPFKAKKVQIQYFKSFQHQGRMYLVGIVNKVVELITDFKIDSQEMNNFLEQHIIFQTSSIPQIREISLQNLIKEFIVRKYLTQTYNNGKEYISLQNMKIETQDLKRVSHQSGPQKISLVILKNNHIQCLQPISELYPNLKSATLNKNRIKNIKGVGKMRNLEKFKAIQNRIQQVPQQIGECQNLQILCLHRNRINLISQRVYQLRNLKQLWLNNNKIEELPQNIEKLHNLTHLMVHNNIIKRLPISICKLQKIENIRVQFNKLQQLPQQISKLKKLNYLYCANNKIKTIPQNFGKLSLVNLSFNNNQLTSFSNQICKLYKLKRLYMAGNQIQQLPQNVGMLSQLILLQLQQNKIVQLSQSFCKLINLNELSLASNKLQNLPDNFGKLSKIKTLNLQKNSLKTLPKSFKELLKVQNLYLAFNEFKQFPEPLLHLCQLTLLNIHDNLIKNLPADIWQLKKLSSLHIQNNQIQQIPDSIISLNNLRDLGVGNPVLKLITPIIYQLNTIKNLQISCIGLQTLPIELFSMQNLEQIDIHGNYLTQLPDQFNKLTNLNKINAQSNQIYKVTSKISSLKKLATIRLKKNRIEYLPKQFYQLKSLRIVNLAFNQIKIIPFEFQLLINIIPKSLYLFKNPIQKVQCPAFMLSRCSSKSAQIIKEVLAKNAQNKDEQELNKEEDVQDDIIQQQT